MNIGSKSARRRGDEAMTPLEWRASLSLALIYMLRMIGLFLILPVFSLYARQLPDATPTLIGLAISAYGLSQALLQIPFGMWSDRVGRKRVIALGSLLFVLGAVVAAQADSIYTIIAGRAIQGAGAVAAVVMALAADLTREEHRTKAMALIGISIGISFALSMVAGPVLSSWIGVPGLFWLVAASGLLSLLVLFTAVPNPEHTRFHRDAQANPHLFGSVFANRELLRLDVGILCLHLILTALFVVTPMVLRDALQLDTAQHWQIYLPVFVGSLLAMVPFIIQAETRRRMKPVFLFGISLISASAAALAWLPAETWAVTLSLFGFFTAFNLLEAILPSLVSKIAPADLKGTAMGVYSTAQFLGTFVGGTSGGWIYGHYGIAAVYQFCAGVALIWLSVAAFMRPPRQVRTQMLNLGTPLSAAHAQAGTQRLLALAGVAEAVIVADEGIAYLKVESDRLDPDALARLAAELSGTSLRSTHG